MSRKITHEHRKYVSQVLCVRVIAHVSVTVTSKCVRVTVKNTLLVNGKWTTFMWCVFYLSRTQSALQLYFASRSPIHTHTHTHRRQRATMQGAGLPIGSNLGFRVLLKHTSHTHCLGGVGGRTANLAISRRPSLPSLPPQPQPPRLLGLSTSVCLTNKCMFIIHTPACLPAYVIVCVCVVPCF